MSRRGSRPFVSPHARQRAFERYGVLFTDRQCKGIYDTIRKGSNIVRLGFGHDGQRIACFFEHRWFLVGCGPTGTVKTFLPPKSLTDEEKRCLRGDAVYRRINVDFFDVLNRTVDTSDVRDLPADLPGQPRGLVDKGIFRRNRKNRQICQGGQVSRDRRKIRSLDADPQTLADFIDDEDFGAIETK